MTDYDTSLPVHVRVGDRREWIVGDVSATGDGRVDPMALGYLLIATGEYMHHLVSTGLTPQDPEDEQEVTP